MSQPADEMPEVVRTSQAPIDGLSPAMRRYLEDRAIDLRVARDHGVTFRGDSIEYPHGRTRNLSGGPKMQQPSGTPLEAWWPQGRPEEARTVFVCEGESDALSALSAGLRVPLVSLPGTGFPLPRLRAELEAIGAKTVYLALDADDAGQKAAGELVDALREVGVRPVPLVLPPDLDLASHLAAYDDTALELRSLMDAADIATRLGLTGAEFLLDSDASVIPAWGSEQHCLWAEGEPFYIFASPGVGKSTLVQQLALVRAGIRDHEVAGHPVKTDPRKVLYLALDRPKQIIRSWRRMVSEKDREALDFCISVWPKPPPFMVSKNPERLVSWVQQFGEVGTVIVDSFFNLAPNLSDEEGAANANNAFQGLMAEGIDLCILHHDRKREQSERKRVTMDDMYGGRPISGGAGAIAYLDGEPNTGKFEVKFVKAPAGPVDPIACSIHFRTGAVEERGAFG